MNRTDAAWAVGRKTIGPTVELLSRLRVYGAERVPMTGGLVLAANHFSWLDPPALGAHGGQAGRRLGGERKPAAGRGLL